MLSPLPSSAIDDWGSEWETFAGDSRAGALMAPRRERNSKRGTLNNTKRQKHVEGVTRSREMIAVVVVVVSKQDGRMDVEKS